MKFWHIVEERAHYADGKIGESISAEIVDVLPRNTSGEYEWHNTETVENGIYTCRKWYKSEAEAKNEIKFWMEH